MTFRRFAPAFLEAFRFRAAGGRDGALAAVKLLQELNRTGRREVPADAPRPFSKAWKSLVGSGAKTDRRLYETAVISTLRDRLRSGDLWIDGARNYRRFDAYLLPRAEVPAAAAPPRPARRRARPTWREGASSWTGGCAASPARSGVAPSRAWRSGAAGFM